MAAAAVIMAIRGAQEAGMGIRTPVFEYLLKHGRATDDAVESDDDLGEEEKFAYTELKQLTFDPEEDAPANSKPKRILSRREMVFVALEEPTSSKPAFAVAAFMTLLVVASTICFCVSSLPQYYQNEPTVVAGMQGTIVGLFTIEYLIKLVTAPKKWEFMKSSSNVIDIMSIVPYYIQLIVMAKMGNSGVGGLVALRVVLLTRIFPLFKLGKYSIGFRIIARTMTQSLDALGLLCFLFLIFATTMASFVFYAEGSVSTFDETTLVWHRDDDPVGYESPFQNIPSCIWWAAVTMTTVGYGDAVPISVPGRAVAVITMVGGILIIAFPITIISHNFSEAWDAYHSGRDKPPPLLRRTMLSNVVQLFRKTNVMRTSDTTSLNDLAKRLKTRSEDVFQALRALETDLKARPPPRREASIPPPVDQGIAEVGPYHGSLVGREALQHAGAVMSVFTQKMLARTRRTAEVMANKVALGLKFMEDTDEWEDKDHNSDEKVKQLLEQESTMRARIFALLDDIYSSVWSRLIGLFMMGLTATYTANFMAESMQSYYNNVPSTLQWMDGIIVVFFTVEYVVRLLVAPSPRWKYALRPLNVLDVIAIIPWYLQLVWEHDAVLVFQILRLTRIIRLFKYSRGSHLVALTLWKSKDALALLLFLFCIAVIFFASLMFYAEQTESTFADGVWYRDANVLAAKGMGETKSPYQSIPMSFWWASETLLTIGYGDEFPISLAGKIVGGIALLLCNLVLAFPLTVIATNFTDVWDNHLKRSHKYRAAKAMSGIESTTTVMDLVQLLTAENDAVKKFSTQLVNAADMCHKRQKNIDMLLRSLKSLLMHTDVNLLVGRSDIPGVLFSDEEETKLREHAEHAGGDLEEAAAVAMTRARESHNHFPDDMRGLGRESETDAGTRRLRRMLHDTARFEKEAQAAFHRIDVNANGHINRDDVGRALGLTATEVDQFFTQYDEDDDGTIAYPEFRQYFRRFVIEAVWRGDERAKIEAAGVGSPLSPVDIDARTIAAAALGAHRVRDSHHHRDSHRSTVHEFPAVLPRENGENGANGANGANGHAVTNGDTDHTAPDVPVVYVPAVHPPRTDQQLRVPSPGHTTGTDQPDAPPAPGGAAGAVHTVPPLPTALGARSGYAQLDEEEEEEEDDIV